MITKITLDKLPEVCYTLELSEKEMHLIEQVRALGFGWLRVIVEDNRPVRIEKGIKSLKL